MKWINCALRLILGSVFVVAAAMKSLAPDEFRFTMAQLIQPIVISEWLLSILMWSIVAVEILLGVLLLSGYRVKQTATASVVLLVVFSAALVVLMVKNESCNCFGTAVHTSGSMSLMRNAILILIAVLIRRNAT
jgi:uncharacterized membrane protein YphA (DoxX/SURF4 family)